MLLWKVSGKSRMIKGDLTLPLLFFRNLYVSISRFLCIFAILYMKIYEMKRHILFILTLLLFFYAKSQPNCIFTHYSSENGLSQNSIMSMVQDHNGVLWFSTWDGINRFNGYDFKVYKARQGNKITMTNNRVDLLEVDPYNYIWLQTYDYRVYRFDQRTEKFEQIPAEGEEEGMRFSSIKILPDSVIWLLSGK